jgi:hypothetical protein
MSSDPAQGFGTAQGADEQVTTLLARAAAGVDLSDPGSVSRLLSSLREAGADEQIATLLARNPAASVNLSDPRHFIDEAKKRGFDLDLTTLRELYRHGLLVPFVEVTYRPIREPIKPDGPEPIAGSSRLMDIREARNTGCLRDLSTEPFKRHLQFERDGQKPRGWWNGFIYSRYQLLALPTLERALAGRKYEVRDKRRFTRLPEPDQWLLQGTEKLRRMVLALTALEARYLPSLDPEWIQLNNVPNTADWTNYRAGFDPVQMQAWLQYPAQLARQDAEWLLFRAHDIDPVGDDWSRLMRRAPARSRKYLKNAALVALDARIAAEILLRFYEDLALCGQTEPLPDVSKAQFFHPLHERLSNHPETLDDDLVRLGISPHPRVVLALEGETEAYHAPLVWQALGFSEAPELMRLLKLGGTNHDLTKVAAVTAAPLVGGKVLPNEWKLIKQDGQSTFDVTKLLGLIDELNVNYVGRHTYASHALLRAILDHIPPILGCAHFAAVANNYLWGQSDKKHIKRLADFRGQADDALHRQISANPDVLEFEDIPASVCVNRLLQECAGRL